MTNRFVQKLFNIISPEGIKCIICDNELDKNTEYCVCDKCFSKLPYIKRACVKCGAEIFSSAHICVECKNDFRHFDRAVSPFNYQDAITSLVYRFKYGGETYLAKYMAFFMTSKLIESGLEFDIIVPVPLNPKRQKLRSFNQAELLARFVSTSLNKPLVNACVERTRDTLTQTHLSKQEREDNLKDAFKVTNKDSIKGKKILLVDDIFTTGATANELAKVFKAAGSNDVYMLTFSHAVNKKENLSKSENTNN